MAQLALGLAGAFVGSFFGPLGASIGWAVGSALGGALFPKRQEGPRLSDLKLQAAAYGASIPILYGVIRTAGNVVWQTNLVEHKHKSGGKGGPQVTTYSYTASFAVMLCEGPILGIKRIWADSRLVYGNGATVGGTALPMTIYLGSETQTADPTMEADKGVGNVPGYRGRAYIVFTDLELVDFYNRIPNFTFEVHASGTPSLVRISTWNIDSSLTGGPSPWSYPFSLNGVQWDGKTITRTRYRAPGDYSFGPNETYIYYEKDTFDLYGKAISASGALTIDIPVAGSPQTHAHVFSCMNADICYWTQQWQATWDCEGTGLPTTKNLAGWMANGVAGEALDPCTGPTGGTLGIENSLFYHQGYIYACGGSNSAPELGGDAAGMWIKRWPVSPEGMPSIGYDAKYVFATATYGALTPNSLDVTVGDDGYVWVGCARDAQANAVLFKFNKDLGLIQYWSDIGITGLALSGFNNFSVVNGYIINRGTFGVTSELVYAISALPGGSLISHLPATTSPTIYLGDGYMATRDGIFRINSLTTLGEIVADISDRVGLGASDYDVTDLPDPVRGYAVTTQMSGRSAIEALMPPFHFGAVESDATAKFLHFGKPSIVTIADSDLGARDAGGEPVTLLQTTRSQDEEIPKRVYVKFLNAEADYQDGTQIWQRQVTSSALDATINAPIVFLPAEAKAIADRIGSNAWIERERHSFYTSRKFAHYEPIDVVTIQGREMRVVNKDEQQSGIIKWDAVASLEAVFVQAPTAVSGSGFVPPDIPTEQATDLYLLDLPLITDGDYPNGYYAATVGHLRSDWRGAELYKSPDGSSFSSIAAVNTADIVGAATTVLGDFTGGNIFDEISTVTIELSWGSGELASATETAVLNGSNEALLGTEIIQFKTATLTAARTYALSGLLRGRRGTEWATATHTVGDRFVMLPTMMNINGPYSEINQSRSFKAVTIGNTLASAAAVSFTNIGIALRPYAPVQLGGGPNAAGDVTLNWVRRTRVGGSWGDLTDAQLSEASEAYIVQIWDAQYWLCARIISVTAAQTTNYTSAMQTTDFGAQQQTIYFTVGQLGAVALGSQARGSAPGSGGSNVAPTTPIAPYAFPVAIATPPAPTKTEDHVFSPVSYERVIVTSLLIGQTWSGKFTTPAGTFNGRILIAEYASEPVFRHCWISTDSGGVNKVANSESLGVTAKSEIGNFSGGAVLASTTTYYWFTDFIMANGSLSGPAGQPAGAFIDCLIQ